jgi:hypothetical protein
VITDLLSVDVRNPINWSHGINRGLVAFWLPIPQLAGGRRLYDLAGRAHGDFVGLSQSQWRSRPEGMAIQFPYSASQYISVPLNWPGDIPVTVTCAVIPPAPSQNMLFGLVTGNDQRRFSADFPWDNGNLAWDYGNPYDGSGRVSFNISSYANILTHFSLVATGSSGAFQAIYINGELKASAANSGSPIAASTFYLGRGHAHAPFNGPLYYFAIRNRVLSPDEIHAEYVEWTRGFPRLLNHRRRFWPVVTQAAPSTGKVPWHLLVQSV